jgi:hypothetical protein
MVWRMRAVLGCVVIVVAVVLSPAGAGAGAKRPSPAHRAATAAKAAGCALRTFAEEGRAHTDGTGTYKTNPPTSGAHNPEPAPDGTYAPDTPPQVEKWVHTLEHGRVLIQYRPESSQRRIDALAKIVAERFRGQAGYHLLLFANNTQMPYAVAAVAWRRYVGCRTFNGRTANAIRAFRTAYVDRAPELIP